jgi:RimJ/RimL family protein N-acetyltransferase
MTWYLETERLSLRPVEPGDVDPLLDVLSDPVSMRFYPRPFDRRMTNDWVTRIQDRYRRDGFGLLAVVEKACRTPVMARTWNLAGTSAGIDRAGVSPSKPEQRAAIEPGRRSTSIT